MASPSPDLSPRPAGAVFLSYAREDTEAARRIADALRAFGVEVWFDQSELRGGDTWDQKIKKQIRECALFVPVVSQQTQERTEGYFRREWLLAVERTRDMAAGRAFIVPVVIDDTPEADAAVPEEFMRFQWTRLAHGVPSPQFVEQVKRLLEAPRKAASASRSRSITQAQPAGRRVPAAAWGAAILVLVLAVGFVLWRQTSSTANAGAAARPPALSSANGPTAEKSAAPAKESEARLLIARAWAILDMVDDATRDDWNLADDLCRRALALAPDDADVWAASSQVSHSFTIFGFDQTPARYETARTQAERAMRLAPQSIEAQFAMANYYRRQTATLDEGVRMLRELAARAPGDKRILRTLANALRGQRRYEESLIYSDRAIALPGGDRAALYGKEEALRQLGRFVEAESALDQALAMGPSPAVYIKKLYYHLDLRGDLEQARVMLEKVPAPFLLEDWGAYHASRVWLWRHDGDRALAVLRAVPRDYLEKAPFFGPKGYLTGMAHQVAGRMDAARSDWQGALRLVEQRLAAQPSDPTLLSWRVLLLARLGQRELAEKSLPVLEQLQSGGAAGFSVRGPSNLRLREIRIILGDYDRVIASLEAALEQGAIVGLVNLLQHDPVYDPLRNNPRFAALLKPRPAPSSAKK